MEMATKSGWLMLERFSSSGVPKAPPALITTLARTCSRGNWGRPLRDSSCEAVVGRPARHASPVARPSSVTIRWTLTPALTRAPRYGSGRYETWLARFASI